MLTIDYDRADKNAIERTDNGLPKRPFARVCTLKHCTLKDAQKRIKDGGYLLQRYEVSETITVSPEEFDSLSENLMAERDYLLGKGGSNSDTMPENENHFTWTNADWRRYGFGMYRLMVLVTDGTNKLLIDPQGYNYARYVAFDANL